jgi:hypothetical protein
MLPKRLSAADVRDAEELLKSPGGYLVYYASKASVDLCKYAAFNVSEAGGVAMVSHIEVDAIMAGWCAELTNITGTPCSAAEPFNEMVAATRCFLERANEMSGRPTVAEFASAVEIFDAAEECMKPVIAGLGSYQRVGFDNHCPGEWGPEPGPAQDAFADTENGEDASLSQTTARIEAAVSAVRAVWRAAGHVGRHADRLHHDTSSDDYINMRNLPSIWKKPCEALGCERNSWMDIEDVLHDHTAELIELNAPVVAIYHHIASRKSARRAHMKMAVDESRDHQHLNSQGFQNQSAVYESGIEFLTRQSNRAESGARRYDSHVRHFGRILSAIQFMSYMAAKQGVSLRAPKAQGVPCDGSMMNWIFQEKDRRCRLNPDGSFEAVIDTPEESKANGYKQNHPRRRRQCGGKHMPSRRRQKTHRRRRCGDHVDTEAFEAIGEVVTEFVDAFQCVGVAIGKTTGYEATIPGGISIAVKVTQEHATNLVNWIVDKGFKTNDHCQQLKFHITATKGMGEAMSYGVRFTPAGISFGGEFLIDTCLNQIFQISASAGSSIAVDTIAGSIGCNKAFKYVGLRCVTEFGGSFSMFCIKFTFKNPTEGEWSHR